MCDVQKGLRQRVRQGNKYELRLKPIMNLYLFKKKKNNKKKRNANINDDR